ncbi:MAG: hypothetical protein GXY36_13300 [Chloroflexi bacterium]|nr:hypothetical protein [Chloroflexota bacterium]
MKRRTIVLLGLVMTALGAALAGCSNANGAGQVIHVEDGAAETQTAQAVAALQNPTATPGPSPTPGPTSTPYVLPTDPAELDPDTVITRVGSEAITLGEFRQRVRFERWRPLYLLAQRAERRGINQVLDLTLPENSMTLALFETLADSTSFGIQVHRIMVINALTLEEAMRRDLDVDPFQFDATLAEYLGMQVGEGGQLPAEFEPAYQEFLAEMERYTGLTEAEFRRIVRAQTLYEQLRFLFSQDPAASAGAAEAEAGIEVQDIVLADEAEAQQVADRLKAGETLVDIATSLGFSATSPQSSRVVRANDPNLPSDVLSAIFSAEAGEVIGPIQMPQGWYVALVQGESFSALSPQELDNLREAYFLDWVEGRMDDESYVRDLDNWMEHIPTEPLPQDVSPLLHDENIKLPEMPDVMGLEETPEATAEAGE